METILSYTKRERLCMKNSRNQLDLINIQSTEFKQNPSLIDDTIANNVALLTLVSPDMITDSLIRRIIALYWTNIQLVPKYFLSPEIITQSLIDTGGESYRLLPQQFRDFERYALLALTSCLLSSPENLLDVVGGIMDHNTRLNPFPQIFDNIYDFTIGGVPIDTLLDCLLATLKIDSHFVMKRTYKNYIDTHIHFE